MRSILSVVSNSLFLVLAIAINCVAQRKKGSSHFPSYEEIRGDRSEIIDYWVPPKTSDGYQPVTRQIMVTDKYWNAFNYPADSAVYYLNGRQAKNQKAAKKELDERSITIERVVIGAVGPKGKRDIEIDYEVKPKNWDIK